MSEEVNEMFSAHNINVNYGKSKIINGLSLHIKEGDKLAILGRNGVGKTTLLKSIMGLLPIEQGSMEFLNKDITRKRTFLRSSEGLGYVPQGREIIPLLTVEENLNLGAVGHKEIDVQSQKEWVLSYFPALQVHLPRKGGVLSGGLQQQLALARCLMSSPRMILLDEPTEGIQPNIVSEIAATLNKISYEKGITLVVVEQNIKFAKKLTDKYVIMQKGSIVAEGKMEALTDEITRRYLAL